ncbi:hypothetical protein EMGBS15_06430 [Filimonas sp.]|jgi:hypothetical protein|nr:hypothetical protein EMGBS15_06430 [Filimonas sp.]
MLLLFKGLQLAEKNASLQLSSHLLDYKANLEKIISRFIGETEKNLEKLLIPREIQGIPMPFISYAVNTGVYAECKNR